MKALKEIELNNSRIFKLQNISLGICKDLLFKNDILALGIRYKEGGDLNE